MKRGNVSGEALLELFQGFPTGNTQGAVAPGMALLRGRPGSAIADPATAAPGPGPLPGISGLSGQTGPVQAGTWKWGRTGKMEHHDPWTGLCRSHLLGRSASSIRVTKIYHGIPGVFSQPWVGRGRTRRGSDPGGIGGRWRAGRRSPGSPTVQGGCARRLPRHRESPFRVHAQGKEGRKHGRNQDRPCGKDQEPAY